MLVQHSNHDMTWFIVSMGLLLTGTTLLNRAKTNKSLLLSGAEAQHMINNARDKWRLGALAVGLFALSFLFVVLGAPTYFDYGETYPWLTMSATVLLGGTAGVLLWRYLRFVKYGAVSSNTTI